MSADHPKGPAKHSKERKRVNRILLSQFPNDRVIGFGKLGWAQTSITWYKAFIIMGGLIKSAH